MGCVSKDSQQGEGDGRWSEKDYHQGQKGCQFTWQESSWCLFFQNAKYTVGDPAFEFIVRPYENKKVTFESRKFGKSYLSMDQSAVVSVRELPPDSSEVHFVVRAQVHIINHAKNWAYVEYYEFHATRGCIIFSALHQANSSLCTHTHFVSHLSSCVL